MLKAQLQISLLDFGYILPNENRISDTVKYTIEMVKLADKLGFKRYWFSEHHNNLTSWTQPEMMISLLASQTRKIKLGTAGILLKYRSAYSVSTNIRLLSTLLPYRLDIGLSSGRILDEYIEQLDIITNKKDFLLKSHEIINNNLNQVSFWFLGTSNKYFNEYTNLKGNFCLSLFHDTNCSLDRSSFSDMYSDLAIKKNFKPEFSIAINCICSNKPTVLKNLYKFLNYDPLYKYSFPNADGFVIGNYNYCLDKLEELSLKYNTKEIVINPMYVQVDNYQQIKSDTIKNISMILQ